MNTGNLEQLIHLTKATFDGDLISKTGRDELHKAELVERCQGWNFITAKGIQLLVDLGILRP